MWLLSADRAKLRFFNSPTDVPHGYAILSHVWGENEQTFQETKGIGIMAQCALDGENPRDKSSQKIRRFCELAESDGYEWGWVDTCCIDKSSSAELSEAINSMFDYYARAEVCYAYLEDVERRGDEFLKSKWHKRGWTLQELLAPEVVVFLTSKWKVVGTKANLADDIQKATGVPKEVLTLEMSLTDTSVAERMSWAADRRTTRLEDEAYCLMGIFGINMPTLYGEGRAAFRRLQEEIMRQCPDTSLFAWGRQLRLDYFKMLSAGGDGYGGLLAPAPAAFKVGEHDDKVRYTARPPKALAKHIGSRLPTFAVTPYGILCTLPILWLSNVILAPLFCTSHRKLRDSSTATDMFLILMERPGARTPLGPLYDVGAHIHDSFVGMRRRLAVWNRKEVNLPNDIHHVTASWEELYLSNGGPPMERPRILTNRALSTPIRIPQWLVQQIRDQDDAPIRISQPAGSMSLEWTGHPTAALEFSFQRQVSSLPPPLMLYYGLCADAQKPTQWVRVAVRSTVEPVEHNCSQDHVNDWPDRSKVFDFFHKEEGMIWRWEYTVNIKFRQSRQNPAALVLSDLKMQVKMKY